MGVKRKRDRDIGLPKGKKREEDNKPEVDEFVGQGEPNNDSEVVDSGSESDSEVEEGSDVNEWDGISGQQNSANGAGHPTSKKLPTGEELRAIKDAADLFRSNSFKLQIDALLPNVRPKEYLLPPLERFLLALHTFLTSLPSVAPQHPLEAARKLLKKNVSVPYSSPLPTEDANWRVAFEKPSDVTLVGSWANKLSIKQKDELRFGVDLALQMPDSLFQEKDYLDGRFFHKRAFYLATIAAAIKNSKSDFKVDVLYDSLGDDPRLTKLVLIPKKDDSPTDFSKLHAQVCIIPTLSYQCPINLKHLSPTHSNIRNQASESGTPTPSYNNALLFSLLPKSHLLVSHALKNESAAFADALALLRIWANQRGYGFGSRPCIAGFESRGFWWGALLALLISGEEPVPTGKMSKRRPLGRGLSSYQLFRAALNFLSKHDFRNEPIFMKTKDGQHKYSPDDWRNNHQCVFVDSTSLVNLLADVPLGSVELLQQDALRTLETLDQHSSSSDPFAQVFLKDQRDLASRFDVVLRVDISSARPKTSSMAPHADSGLASNALLASLDRLLHQGLGDRTRAVAILKKPTSPRKLSQAHPSTSNIVFIGLIHDAEHAFRLVDHGPAADESDESIVRRFRDFWGDKAELRRFKDGRIIESVVWDVKTLDERAHIPTMIVRHVLKRHFNVGEDAVQTWQTSFDSTLRLPEAISSKYMASKVATGFKGALTAFDNLVKEIKALEDELPLALLNITPVSEQLRYTSVFSPVPLPTSLSPLLPPNSRYLAPIEIVLQFEKSSRWPDELKATQKIKFAFFERIASALMSSINGLRASIVVGDGVSMSEILDKACLEIVTPEGWAFIARIWHDREATLLDRIIENKTGKLPHVTMQKISGEGRPNKEYHDAVDAKSVHMRRFIHAPRHHRAIAALSHQYNAFSGTVRLVKRWLASHWVLHGQVSDEAVELICASQFVGDGKSLATGSEERKDSRARVPGSKERGFASVVAFLKDWKWEDGLQVPLYGKDGDGSQVNSTLPSYASAGVWKISTELDRDGHVWTSHGPDPVVARRIKALAKATWDCLGNMEHGNLDVRSMFIHPTNDYDFVVRLDPSVLTRYHQNISVDNTSLRGKYANLQNDNTTDTVRPGFDPARTLFDDLQRTYIHSFKIFYDPFGGDQFGAVWDPTLKEPRPFRVLGAFSSAPVAKENEKAKDKGHVILNDNGVLGEIERLGMGLIKEIVVQV